MSPGKLNSTDLIYIAPFVPLDQAPRIIEALEETFTRYGLTARLHRAHFLGQIAQESWEFRATEERDWSGDHWAYLQGRTDLGCKPDDDTFARRHHGRSWMQTTGIPNQRRACEALGLNFDRGDWAILGQYPYCAFAAGVYWKDHQLNAMAERDDIEAITLRINGGYHGLDKRRRYVTKAKECYGIG